MTKQEEIRHWFCKYLAQFNRQLNYDRLPQHRKDSYKLMVEEDVIPYLHSQGVVIKVDKKLPTWALAIIGDELPNATYKVAQKDMLIAGYVATEPLIKEVPSGT